MPNQLRLLSHPVPRFQVRCASHGTGGGARLQSTPVATRIVAVCAQVLTGLTRAMIALRKLIEGMPSVAAARPPLAMPQARPGVPNVLL